jgi:nucleoside-diphosphate-sugar epimerase
LSRILLFGSRGYLGSAISDCLIAAGHHVTAVARDSASAVAIQARGLESLPDSIEDMGQLVRQLHGYDALVFAAKIAYEREEAVYRALLDGFDGTDRPFVMTSGTGVLGIPAPDGSWSQETFTEDDSFTPPPWLAVRARTEEVVRRASDRGVHTLVIRPPLIWGRGGSVQVPAVFDSVQRTGTACYLGAGLNVYSNVHVDDLAELYRLALDHGTPGAVYHAVAGEINFRTIAEHVAAVMNTTARSVEFSRAQQIWGPVLARTGFGVNSRSRTVASVRDLGWRPRHTDLAADITEGSYRAAYAAQAG